MKDDEKLGLTEKGLDRLSTEIANLCKDYEIPLPVFYLAAQQRLDREGLSDKEAVKRINWEKSSFEKPENVVAELKKTKEIINEEMDKDLKTILGVYVLQTEQSGSNKDFMEAKIGDD